MKKRMQIISALLLSVSLLFPAKTVFSQEDNDIFLSYTPLAFRAMVNGTLEGKNGIEALRGVRDSYSQGLDDLATGFINNENQGALEAYEEYRSVTLKYLDARLKQAEEQARQAENDHFRNVMFVIQAVLIDGADSANRNTPTEPNPVIAKFLPIHVDQTKKNAADQLYGHAASGIPNSGSVIASSSSQIYHVDAGLPASSAPPVVAQVDTPTVEPSAPTLVPTIVSVSNGGNSGGSDVNILKPLRFTNKGLYDATVRAFSYTPAEGVTAGMSSASTVVFRESNPTAYLDLPLGTYVFCYYWDLGTDVDNDGYVDYAHRNTGSVTLSGASSDNTTSAQVVTLNPENMNNPNGKCGVTPPVEDAGELTPQELANQGTHTYAVTCAVEGRDGYGTFTFEFLEGGMNYSYTGGTVAYFMKIDVNTYGDSGTALYEEITFTDIGFMYRTEGAGDSKDYNCIMRRE